MALNNQLWSLTNVQRRLNAVRGAQNWIIVSKCFVHILYHISSVGILIKMQLWNPGYFLMSCFLSIFINSYRHWHSRSRNFSHRFIPTCYVLWTLLMVLSFTDWLWRKTRLSIQWRQYQFLLQIAIQIRGIWKSKNNKRGEWGRDV